MTTPVEQRRAKTGQFYTKLRESFRARLKSLTSNEENKENLSIWLLSTSIFTANGSQVAINNLNDPNSPKFHSLRFKYLHVQTYSNAMNLNQLNLNVANPDEINFDGQKPLDLNTNYLDPAQSNLVSISKLHIHTWFAVNHEFKLSIPLVIYPKSDENLEANLDNKAIKKAACVHESQNGDLNSLSFILDWLKHFAAKQLDATNNPKEKTIILANSYVYLKLCLLGQKEPSLLDEINTFLDDNRIRFIFYPIENSNTENMQIPLLDNLFWQIVGDLSLRANPSSQLSFLQAFRQALREILEKKNELRSWFIRFAQMAEIETYMEELIPKVVEPPPPLPPPAPVAESVSSSSSREDVRTIKREDSRLSISEYSQDSPSGTANSNGSGGGATSSVQTVAYKLTDADINEYCQWVDDMSKIGSLCIKYTFLRDMYLKQYSSQVQQQSYKEPLANEKKWLELISPKNRSKFHYADSMGLLTENDYLLKWLDVNSWRLNYYNFIRSSLPKPVTSADQLWTFDMLTFPYFLPQSLLRQPERDLENRPRNLKPRVSVMFAFSASGDYLPPYFVYPQTFADGDESPSESSSNDHCISSNGYVTFRVFENWLFNMFLPYLEQQHKNATSVNDFVLLFCSKLALFDKSLMSKLKEFNENATKSRLNLFSIAHESQMPFESLFKKNLRKRQTDLFLDSWRKITTKLGLSYQFKCNSKQQFFNLFTDAFQNCIEEIGNECANEAAANDHQTMTTPTTTTTTASQSSSSVQHFRAKMANSFEQCKLWPVSDEDYRELVDEMKKKEKGGGGSSSGSSGNGSTGNGDGNGGGGSNNNNNNNTRTNVTPLATIRTQAPAQTPPVTKALAPQSRPVTAQVAPNTDDEAMDDSNSSELIAIEEKCLRNLADLINNDAEMQKNIKDMIKSELGKLICNINPVVEEPAVVKPSPQPSHPLAASTKINRPEPNKHVDLVRDLLELLVESKRKESPFGLRAAFNDLNSLQKKFESLKQNSERKSDLLRKIVTSLVPSTSKVLLNDLSKLLCDYYNNK